MAEMVCTCPTIRGAGSRSKIDRGTRDQSTRCRRQRVMSSCLFQLESCFGLVIPGVAVSLLFQGDTTKGTTKGNCTAKRQLTDEQVEELKEYFAFFDKDGNDCISTRELKLAMQSFGDNPTDQEAEAMVKAADKDGNGTVEFNEFVDLMAEKMNFCSPEQDLVDAFKTYDKNGDGIITAEELKHYLTECGDDKLTIEEAVDLIRDFDTNGDGVLDYEEFCKMMAS